MGPLLFIVFISDISNFCLSSQQIVQYADDINIVKADDQIEQVTQSSNEASHEFNQYCKDKIRKTNFMRFLPKNILPDYEPYLHVDGKTIQSIKFLRIILDDPKLNWETHKKMVTSKLSKGDTIF